MRPASRSCSRRRSLAEQAEQQHQRRQRGHADVEEHRMHRRHDERRGLAAGRAHLDAEHAHAEGAATRARDREAAIEHRDDREKRGQGGTTRARRSGSRGSTKPREDRPQHADDDEVDEPGADTAAEHAGRRRHWAHSAVRVDERVRHRGSSAGSGTVAARGVARAAICWNAARSVQDVVRMARPVQPRSAVKHCPRRSIRGGIEAVARQRLDDLRGCVPSPRVSIVRSSETPLAGTSRNKPAMRHFQDIGAEFAEAGRDARRAGRDGPPW